MSNTNLNQKKKEKRKKKERRGNEGRKKEEEEEEEEEEATYRKKEKKKKGNVPEEGEKKVKKSNIWTKPMCKCTRVCWVFLSIKQSHFLSSVFFSILGRKFFGRSEEKKLGPHNLFSFFSIQPNTLKKSFHFHFLSKVLHPPYFTSKQTHSSFTSIYSFLFLSLIVFLHKSESFLQHLILYGEIY